MTEQTEELYGKDAELQRAGYVEMPPPVPDLEPMPDIDFETAVSERGSAGEAVEEITYNQVNRDGTRSGEPSPKNQSISPERGAEDLTNWRDRKRETEQALRDQQLKQQLDAARSPLGAEVDEAKAGSLRLRTPEEIALLPIDQQIAILEEQRQHAAQQQGQQQQQQPQPQAVDQDVQAFGRVLEQNPKWLQMIEQRDQQVWHQANQAQQAAHQSIEQNSNIATALLLIHHPKLQNLIGMNRQQQDAAMQMYKSSDPAGYAQFESELGRVQGVLQYDQQVKQQQAQREATEYVQKWQRFSSDEDTKFIQRAPEHADAQYASSMYREAIDTLKEKGFSEDDLGKLWSGQNSVSLRDHRMQLLIRDATLYRRAKGAVPTARRNVPARVQRPGAYGQIASQQDVDAHAASNQLAGATGNQALRLAAQLLTARRARSR